MPQIGFGVYQIPPAECEKVVSEAISVGYRSFDTAQVYLNEEQVGSAIKKSGIPRSEFFITTKVWATNTGYERAKASIEESLKKLQTDYIDLLLIHECFGDYYGAWRAMEEYYKAGKLRVIGVSNFYPDRLVDFCNFVEIKPFINQVEMNAFQQQKKAREYMKKYNVVPESWAPFAEGRKGFFNNPIMNELGKKYNKTPAQVILRYFVENGVVCIPKSVHKERMLQNKDIFDFKLDDDDKKKIETLDEGTSSFFSHYDYETAQRIANYKI